VFHDSVPDSLNQDSDRDRDMSNNPTDCKFTLGVTIITDRCPTHRHRARREVASFFNPLLFLSLSFSLSSFQSQQLCPWHRKAWLLRGCIGIFRRRIGVKRNSWHIHGAVIHLNLAAQQGCCISRAMHQTAKTRNARTAWDSACVSVAGSSARLGGVHFVGA